MIAAFAARLGFVRASTAEMYVKVAQSELKDQLQYAFSINKRLDEHRELISAIATKSTVFQQCPYHLEHAATQDDYLMRLFNIVHGSWPNPTSGPHPGSVVRPRPEFLRDCELPEYLSQSQGSAA